MPDPIARERLKKKVLDRWENEGGRIAADPTSADAARATNELQGKGKQPSASRHNSKVGVSASLVKKRKPTRK